MPDELDAILKRAEVVSRRIDAERAVCRMLERLGQRMTSQRLHVQFADDLPQYAVGEYRHDLKRIRLHRKLVHDDAELLKTFFHELGHASVPLARGPAAEREAEALANKVYGDLTRGLARRGMSVNDLRL